MPSHKGSTPREALAVLTTAEMAAVDRGAAAAGTPVTVLMDRAGRAVAEHAERMLQRHGGGSVLVLCGPGDNGGDGFVAANLLAARGRAVTVASLMPVSELRAAAAAAAASWRGPVVEAATVDPQGYALVIDALFGAGLSRPIAGATRAVLGRVAAAQVRVLAVDLPSGLSGDTGAVMGTALRADETVTFFRLKPGHLLMPGRELCGTVTLADIGLGVSALDGIAPTLFHDRPELWWGNYPKPAAAGHKYTRGHLLVVSGPMPTLGASRLSARAGLRVGAGLVTLATPEDGLAAHAAQLTSVMVRPFAGPPDLADILADARKNAVVIGPGLGHHDDTLSLVEAVLAPGGKRLAPGNPTRAAVLDADALTLFAGRPDDLAALVRRAPGPVVVTPHDGEFAKLFAGDGAILNAVSKVDRARAGARRLGAVLVLKGPDTVVAAPDGHAAIAGEDAPWLATAGTGDVLAGLVGGLLAQSMPAFEAACAAVWLHATVGRRIGPGLISEDLPEALPSVLRDLFGRTDLS